MYKVKEDSHITIIIIIIIIIIIVIIMMIIIIIIPIMIGALGTISGNAKAWNGRLSLPDIFGSAHLSASLGLPIAESVMSLTCGIAANT